MILVSTQELATKSVSKVDEREGLEVTPCLEQDKVFLGWPVFRTGTVMMSEGEVLVKVGRDGHGRCLDKL